MRIFVLIVAVATHCTAVVQPSLAHGDEPHPKCKRGYVVSDDHRCIKIPNYSATAAR